MVSKLSDQLIYFLYKIFGNFRFVNASVRKFYLHILIPALSIYLKTRYKNIISIEKRHSLLDKDSFNAFLSDIDLSIIIEEKSEYIAILKTFFFIKNIFIMFDIPEIYYQEEFEKLEDIKKSKQWSILYTLWSIRKINWNYQSIKNNPTYFNVFKKNRSIQMSFSKILSKTNHQTKQYELVDFKFLSQLTGDSDLDRGHQQLCYYSYFLETNSPTSIQLLLSSSEIKFFNSLMPGEVSLDGDFELKKMITLYEILITKTSMRVDEAHSKTNQQKKEWIKLLEKQFLQLGESL